MSPTSAPLSLADLDAREIETMARLVAAWQYAARSGSHAEEQAAYRALEASVMSRVAQLVAAARRGMEDAARLDWLELEANLEPLLLHDGRDDTRGHRGLGLRPGLMRRDLREAIDTASRAGRPTEGTDDEKRQEQDQG